MGERLLDPKQELIIKNPKHELFCQFYVKNEALFGNATLCYGEAYDYKLDELPDDDQVYESYNEEGEGVGKIIEKSTYAKAYNVCSVEGMRLLRMPKIQARLTALLNEIMTDEIVDSQLAKIIIQNKDLKAKIAAIKAYNDIKGRVVKKMEHTGKDGGPIQYEDLSELSDDELNKLIEEGQGGEGEEGEGEATS